MFDTPCLLSSHWFNPTMCVISAFVVGLSGVVPLLFIPLKRHRESKQINYKILNRWLSYAVGSLLGEVFIHLLPESWDYQDTSKPLCSSAFWLLMGLLFFFFVEKLAACNNKNKHVDGYLNLFANVIDNFAHGVAIGGSYLVSSRLGFLTTTCILVHEVPHEMADFVILLRSGFSRWQAAKAQFVTASGSTLGAISTLFASATISGWSAKWILPFTAGGFLYIALVTLLPDIIKECSIKESIMHMLLILTGFVSMGVVSFAIG